jgi:hypothetical protein
MGTIPEIIPGRKRGLAPEIRRVKARNPKLGFTAIARKVGCSPSNVSCVLRKFLAGRTPEEAKEFQASKPEILENLQHQIVESITPQKLVKTSAAQLVTMFAILQDKLQVLRGQPSSIAGIAVLLDVVAAIKERDAGAPRVISAGSASTLQGE